MFINAGWISNVDVEFLWIALHDFSVSGQESDGSYGLCDEALMRRGECCCACKQ